MKRNRKKLQIISHCRSAVGHANSGKYFPPCLEAIHWGSATIFCSSNPASYAVIDLKDVALTNFLRLVTIPTTPLPAFFNFSPFFS
jgi:hypothetical protein